MVYTYRMTQHFKHTRTEGIKVNYKKGIMDKCKGTIVVFLICVSLLQKTESAACGTTWYNPTFKTCCNGVLYTPKQRACCGTVGYDPTFKTCCNGVLNTPKQRACCGTVAYDPTFKTCCNGELNTPKQRACCGTIAYDPTFKTCCNGVFC
ncbi:Hypothetical predicted protein [Mytilus galloprovincialis]|uniref:Galaxin-like repeats domain-containing protein n=2 Tax=Mytilus galloprovincialis TaxID=29158 RepID=A0A8B6C4G5_MYTGA|nr:Hypothetical predicted protein [Mytilus galloprovincialis]